MEGVETKVCAMCKIDKPKTDYHKLSTKKCGVQSKCRQCMSEYKKNRYWNNRDIELAKMTSSRLKPENKLQRKGYYQENKDEYKERYLKWIADDKNKKHRSDVAKIYNKVAYEKISKRAKKYRQREEVKIRQRAKHHDRRKSDMQYVLKRRLRFRLRHIVRALGNNKYKWMSSTELLGCDMEFFKKYIESRFKDGMCWERLSEIHIDHIKPCSRFDLTKLDEQKKCFHYLNLQPLWWKDNLEKHDSYQENE